MYKDHEIIHEHLVWSGFMDNYFIWSKHDETQPRTENIIDEREEENMNANNVYSHHDDVGECRYLADQVPLHTSFKSRQGTRCAPTCHHVPYSNCSSLPVTVGSRAATCPVAPDPASLIGRAPMPSCVPWLRTLPSYRRGLQWVMCHIALDPAFLQGRDLEHHRMSCGSCLPTWRALVPLPHALRSPMGRGP
jgi:hypothetical protein